MSKKGAVKTGSGDPGQSNKNKAMAAYMAKKGIRRTVLRDPITNSLVSLGTYPGMPRKSEA